MKKILLIAVLCAAVLVASPVLAKGKHHKKAVKATKPAVTSVVKTPVVKK